MSNALVVEVRMYRRRIAGSNSRLAEERTKAWSGFATFPGIEQLSARSWQRHSIAFTVELARSFTIFANVIDLTNVTMPQ